MVYKKTSSPSVNDFVGKRPQVTKPTPQDDSKSSSVTPDIPSSEPVRRRIHISHSPVDTASSDTGTLRSRSGAGRVSALQGTQGGASKEDVSASHKVPDNDSSPSVGRSAGGQQGFHGGRGGGDVPGYGDSGQSGTAIGQRYGGYQQRQQRSFDRGSYDRTDAQGPTETVKGFLDIQLEGHGFLRPKFIPSSRDIYISQSQIRRFMLRAGDEVEGLARPPKDTERYYGLLKVEKVNESSADDSGRRPYFDDLTPLYPNKQIILGTGKTPLSTRMIDMFAPIGFGQRGMIVSPPKAGKTTILKEIAAGISKNFPDVHLMAALIGERPEEVTDITMSVRGEVVSSNFDEPPENQTRVAEITLERAKRLVELGKDVIILLDSITRLARAYNLSVDPSGRTLSGGFDPAALYPAKRFFGAARNCKEGGSLTIIGTALVETGSRMDDLIYEEFKGTGNMELHLVRSLAERRIYPAISVEKSGTRGEERILPDAAYKKLVTMRRMMDMLNQDERTSILVERLGKTDTNEEFLENLGKG
jgi:transcription termination factor Rho